MFKEWKAIFKKPVFIIVMIGVSLIPALYNVIFLSSMWDPYGKLSDLPVAVVNKDQTAQFHTQTLSVGQDMVNNLKKNDSLDFHFVSEDKAKKGLEKGDYYMIVTIPSDLSQKAASILSDQPEQMTIDYQTSSGHSFIASKMSDSAMKSIQQTVANNITNTYTRSLFDNMETLKVGIGKAATGSTSLVNGGEKLTNGSLTLTNNLTTLANSSLTFSNGAEQLTTGLGTYTLGVARLANGLGTFAPSLSAYTDGVEKIAAGSSRLENGLVAYTTGVADLAKGTDPLSHGLDAYTTGVANLSNGANQLNNNSQNLVNGAQQLADSGTSIQALADGANQLAAGLDALSQNIANNSSANTLTHLQDLQVGLENIQAEAAASPNLSSLKASLLQSLDSIETAVSQTANTSDYQQNLISNVSQTVAYQKLSPEEQAQITAAISQTTASDTTASITQQIQGLRKEITNLPEQSASHDTTLTQAKTTLAELEASYKQSQTSLLTNLQTMTNGATQVANGVNQLHSQFTTGTSQLVKGIQEYTNGVAQITDGSHQLSTQNGQLTDGLAKIHAGAHQLANQNDEVTAGIGQIAGGGAQLVNNHAQISSALTQLTAGSQQLQDNSEALVSGSHTLANGSKQISNGAEQLANGGNTLSTGLSTFTQGAEQLASGLEEAREQLSIIHTTSSNADTLSNPLNTHKTDKDNVKTNGIGMAPYMISVALFVAAISTNIIFATLPSGKTPQNRRDWLKARLEVNGIISILAGLLVYGAVHLIGLSANHEWMTLAMILLASMTFMAVVTTLVTWDSKLGAFVSLILLLLQLASSAGTYPLPLTDAIFQTINPWLPMSYAVSGLRETISMTGQIGGQIAFLVGTLLFFILAGYLIYNPNKKELMAK